MIFKRNASDGSGKSGLFFRKSNSFKDMEKIDADIPVIVTIDDDGRICETIRLMLESFSDFSVLSASSGADGVALVRKIMPDMVILDINMPGMDGLEVLKKVKEDPATSHIPVIMLTARRDEASMDTASHSYADAYLLKPCSVKELFSKISLIMSCRKMDGADKLYSDENVDGDLS